MRVWTLAEDEAVRVFAANLRDLLLAAPAGTRATMGLDPGYRTGVKVAVVDATGKVVAPDTIYPHVPHNKCAESLAKLASLAKAHKVELIAIGNGTASRETDKLASELVAGMPELNLTKIVVSEAGASVYSASAFASQELPSLDVSLRGAVSIARRLQDPLAELVKIDPKSIGVGQYQHDLAEGKLSGTPRTCGHWSPPRSPTRRSVFLRSLTSWPSWRSRGATRVRRSRRRRSKTAWRRSAISRRG